MKSHCRWLTSLITRQAFWREKARRQKPMKATKAQQDTCIVGHAATAIQHVVASTAKAQTNLQGSNALLRMSPFGLPDLDPRPHGNWLRTWKLEKACLWPANETVTHDAGNASSSCRTICMKWWARKMKSHCRWLTTLITRQTFWREKARWQKPMKATKAQQDTCIVGHVASAIQHVVVITAKAQTNLQGSNALLRMSPFGLPDLEPCPHGNWLRTWKLEKACLWSANETVAHDAGNASSSWRTIGRNFWIQEIEA